MVEERSMEAFLNSLLPTIISPPHTWVVHTLSCFTTKLEGRLRGYSHNNPDTINIIIISDLDRKNCIEKKQWLEEMVLRSGLKTKTNPAGDGSYSVITRLAIQELESWLLGDSKALHTAYNKIPESIGTKSKYQNPDILRNTWESFHALLKKEGYCCDVYPKIEVAWRVGQHIDYRINKSPVFNVYQCDILVHPFATDQ